MTAIGNITPPTISLVPTRPNLFVIGAMKSGTSSLHAYMAQHPDVFMSTPKEPSYFVDRNTLWQVWPEMASRRYWRDEASYLSLFEPAGSARVVGESSTNYTKLRRIQGVPQRIAAFNPDARFIYLIRDPVRRAISHYLHEVRHGHERRDIMTALRTDPGYVDVSHYAMQLKAYFDVFDRARVNVLTTEELNADPSATMHALFRWLGVDPDFVPPNLHEHRGTTPFQFQPFRPAAVRLRHNRVWRTVSPHLPAALRTRARRLGRAPEVELQPPAQAEVVAYLRPIQRPQVDSLERLLGRSFRMWTTLYGDT